MEKLQRLTLIRLKISHLPTELFSINSLIELYLRGNRLSYYCPVEKEENLIIFKSCDGSHNGSTMITIIEIIGQNKQKFYKTTSVIIDYLWILSQLTIKGNMNEFEKIFR